jgi:hypothetical protein
MYNLNIIIHNIIIHKLPNDKIYEELDDKDLEKKQYDIDTLVWNIKYGAISLRKLVRTQKLTPYICAKYVVFGGKNGKYAFGTEDSWLSRQDICDKQPHITIDEMHEAYRIANAEDELEDDD